MFSDDKKDPTSVMVADPEGADMAANEAATEKFGTAADQLDMRRMGKKQTLRRNFGFFSIFGFTMILLNSWEIQLSTLSTNLATSGTAGVIYMYIGVFFGMLAVVLSMAEMAAIAPTAGGQYHWVSEFAPPRAQKFLSYLVGWLSVLGWQSGAASTSFLSGSQIQGLLILNYRGDENTPATYNPKSWHGSLLTCAVILFCAIFNTFLARKLPLVEGVILVLHIFGFFAIMIPLLVMAPMRTGKDVFTTFYGGEIWGNQGLSCLVGMLGPVVALLGADSATHMAEELQDAARHLPRAMCLTVIINGILGISMLIVACFSMGDIEAASQSNTGFPYMEIFYNATGSLAGSTVMSCIILVMAIFCCISNVATASRQLFAFARDHGIPFSSWFSAVPGNWDIPLNAIIFTTIVSSLLSFINIGSTIAYNIITSMGVNGLLTSYLVSIACVLLKRLRGEKLRARSFDLGRFGLPINVVGLGFITIAYIFCFFPQMPNPAPKNMNWGVLVYAGVVIFSFVYFFFKGRHTYAGPVAYVDKSL